MPKVPTITIVTAADTTGQATFRNPAGQAPHSWAEPAYRGMRPLQALWEILVL